VRRRGRGGCTSNGLNLSGWEELTRLIYALDKTRACPESAITIEAAQAERAKADAIATKQAAPVTVNIAVIPSGMHLNEAGHAKLDSGEQITSDDLKPFKHTPLIEHQPAPREEPREPQSAREAQLLAALEALPEEELARRVSVAFGDVLQQQLQPAASSVPPPARVPAHVDDDGGVIVMDSRLRPLTPPRRTQRPPGPSWG
jgi:hypothetical protein